MPHYTRCDNSCLKIGLTFHYPTQSDSVEDNSADVVTTYTVHCRKVFNPLGLEKKLQFIQLFTVLFCLKIFSKLQW